MAGPQPLWLNKTDKVKKSKAHELRLAKELGGSREIRSGANKFSPYGDRTMGRDINTKDFLVEHKNTVNASISLKREWLEGIKTSSACAMKDPMLIITFQSDNEKPEDWVMIPLDVYKRIKQNNE